MKTEAYFPHFDLVGIYEQLRYEHIDRLIARIVSRYISETIFSSEPEYWMLFDNQDP